MSSGTRDAVEQALDGTSPAVTWSVVVRRNDDVLIDHHGDVLLPTASMGKVFLLTEVARRLDDGSLGADERLAPAPGDVVADSGLWQHLDERDLAVASLAALVGAVSDNLATNVLLRRVGLTAVQDVSAALGMPETRMLDRIRDVRGPVDPPAPSVSRAQDLATFMSLLAGGRVVSPNVSARVRDWLTLGVDLSMVASAFGLDPLAHADDGTPVRLVNKTGTDAGVRADAGFVRGTGVGDVAYAAIATWDPQDVAQVRPVLQAMRAIGAALAD